MEEAVCSICKRVVASGPNAVGVKAAAASHQKKAHPKKAAKK